MQAEAIRKMIKENEEITFNYSPKFKECDFESQHLRNLVGACDQQRIDFLPHIAADMIHDEARKRFVKILETQIKNMSIEHLFEAFKEVNLRLLKDELERAEARELVEVEPELVESELVEVEPLTMPDIEPLLYTPEEAAPSMVYETELPKKPKKK